jgi:hypothetical protein
MSNANKIHYNPWPALPYEAFKPTGHLLHMGLQAIGKLKLHTPFGPHWTNVALFITSRGLTTGPIPYASGIFSVDIDFIHHEIICMTSWGSMAKFKLGPLSVAQFTSNLFDNLHNIGIDMVINPKPQEVPDPVLFNQDTVLQPYDPVLANAWWQIMVSSLRVMERYHARFTGTTPPIGLMWGTLDLRDARYKNTQVPTTGMNASYIRRNAMDVAQIEAGWWYGNEAYPRPAYFSFMYPQPDGIEQAKIKPNAARWEKSLGEFILDYDEVRNSNDPEGDLLAFFESAYQAGAELAHWSSKLISKGVPV